MWPSGNEMSNFPISRRIFVLCATTADINDAIKVIVWPSCPTSWLQRKSIVALLNILYSSH